MHERQRHELICHALFLIALLVLLPGCAGQYSYERTIAETESKLIAAYRTVEHEKRTGMITGEERDKLLEELDKVGAAIDQAQHYKRLGDQAGADSNAGIASGLFRAYLVKKMMKEGDP
ncbi:MAG: hypothetical protein AAF542_17930 [Pseudomonadota bacterium]